jgi:uncharacterized membrane-anchored protein
MKNTYSKSEALSRVNSREDKYNNKQDRTRLLEYNWAAGWIETSVGWYSVQDGELIHAQDSEQVKYDPDSWVNVSDLSDLTIDEYSEVKEQLLKWLKFDIENKYI